MIETYLECVIQDLSTSPVVSAFNVIRQEWGEEEGYIRIKCHLSNGDILEFAEYVEVLKEKVCIVTYSYHWQDLKGQLVKRWDNVGHHKEIDTFPYHLHLSTGEVIGTTSITLNKVLKEIEKVFPVKYTEE